MENQIKSEELEKIRNRGIDLNKRTREKVKPSAEDIVEEIKQEDRNG